jgi:type IV pilus assembly protein PilE
MLIVVAIIGILAAVAFPAYNGSVRKSRRTDAKTALLDLAQREERYMSTGNTFTNDPAKLGYPSGTKFPLDILTGSKAYYTLDFDSAPTSTAFKAKATPVGDQAKDKCGTFYIEQSGAQTVSTSVADCW